MACQPVTANRAHVGRLAAVGLLTLEAAIGTGVLSLFLSSNARWVDSFATTRPTAIVPDSPTHR